MKKKDDVMYEKSHYHWNVLFKIRVGNDWKLGNGDIETMTEKEALIHLISYLRDEVKLSGSDSAVLVTPRYDVSLALLISALNTHHLVTDFLSIVTGLGDMEMLAASKQLQFRTTGLQAYFDYYQQHKHRFRKILEPSVPQHVPKIMFMILEVLLNDQPRYDNFHKFYIRPLMSPYTNKLCYNSQILEVRENFHRISVLTQVNYTNKFLINILIPLDVTEGWRHRIMFCTNSHCIKNRYW